MVCHHSSHQDPTSPLVNTLLSSQDVITCAGKGGAHWFYTGPHPVRNCLDSQSTFCQVLPMFSEDKEGAQGGEQQDNVMAKSVLARTQTSNINAMSGCVCKDAFKSVN